LGTNIKKKNAYLIGLRILHIKTEQFSKLKKYLL